MDSLDNIAEQGMHPIRIIEEIKKANGTRNLLFEYSIYTPGPPGITLSRNLKRVNANDLHMSWLLSEIRSLAPSEELAWHSRVHSPDGVFHIPMVDFVGRMHQEEIGLRLAELGERVGTCPYVYDSGRSRHAYFGTLLDEAQWHSFLGSVLLLNPSGTSAQHIVDCRWVGHSLEHGYSALRWSCNSPMYSGLPTLVPGTF